MAHAEGHWNTVDFSALHCINWEEYNCNLCRSLVEVPGCVEWKIRRFSDSLPQYCWKYIDAKIIAHYYFEKASKVTRSATSNNQLNNIPLFYATLPYFSSPFEISIQPRFLDKIREKLQRNLVDFYSKNSLTFGEGQIFESVPCALKLDNEYFRGKIIKIHKDGMSAIVLLVDLGAERIVFLKDIYPLTSQFGRIPPLALKCRVKDVFVNDLDTGKVEYFKQLINSLSNTVRVEICSNEEPFFVNLFHPTISGENICRHFYRPPNHEAREEAKQRRWLEHKRRQACENDSDFDDDDDDSEDEERDEEEEEQAIYIQSFGRSAKYPRGLTDILNVVHIENATLIYLRSKWMQAELQKMERSLSDEWNSFPSFPTDQLSPGTACAATVNNNIYRGVVEESRHENVELFLLDYGKYVSIPMAQTRALPHYDPFIFQPMVYVVSLERDFHYFPHPSETQLLKKLLPVGSTVVFNATKYRSKIPVLGQILGSTNENIDQLLTEQLVD